MTTRRDPPICARGPRWIRERLTNGDRKAPSPLAPLTGQDAAALRAFLHLVELYGYADGEGRRCALIAMRATVRAMQPSVRHLAKAGIPCVLDWSHEDEIWQQLERPDDVATEPMASSPISRRRGERTSEGRRAGPIRNGRMLDLIDRKTGMLLAFPGGAGSRDAVAQAMRRGIVVEHAARGRQEAFDAMAAARRAHAKETR